MAVVLRQKGTWKHGYLYNPEQLTLKSTSPLSTTPFVAVDVGYVGLNQVSNPIIFELTVTPAVDITSYFVVKLPSDFVHNDSLLFNPSCLQADQIDIFYRSDLVRIYPLGGTHFGGTSLTYTIQGFPSTQYAFDFAIWPITI